MQAQHNPTISPEAVRARAYELWEKHGRPQGHDLDYWLEAERDLAKEAASAGEIEEVAPPPARRARAQKAAPAAKSSTRTRTTKK